MTSVSHAQKKQVLRDSFLFHRRPEPELERLAARPAASTSEMGRLESEWLTTDANLTALANLSGRWIDRVHERRPPDGIIPDVDGSRDPRPTARKRALPGTAASAAPAATRCSSSTKDKGRAAARTPNPTLLDFHAMLPNASRISRPKT